MTACCSQGRRRSTLLKFEALRSVIAAKPCTLAVAILRHAEPLTSKAFDSAVSKGVTSYEVHIDNHVPTVARVAWLTKVHEVMRERTLVGLAVEQATWTSEVLIRLCKGDALTCFPVYSTPVDENRSIDSSGFTGTETEPRFTSASQHGCRHTC
jgi:hypothetical protein